MKRRMFVAGAMMAALGGGRVAAQGLTKPDAGDSSRPEPVELSEHLVLLDYFFLADNFDTYMLGEVENLSDEPFDAVPIMVTFMDAAGDVLESLYLTPPIAVIEPGQRVPVDNVFSEFNPLEDDWSEVTFTICGEHPLFEYAEQQATMEVEMDDLAEDKTPTSYLAEGVIRNEGDDEVRVDVHVIYRDAEDRLVGYSREWLDPIPAGDELEFSVGASTDTLASPTLDPFVYIEGEYTTELVVSIARSMGYVIEC